MARNSIAYALILLIIGVVVICFAVDNVFHDTIPEFREPSSYYVANEALALCIKQCKKKFPSRSKVYQECMAKCLEQFSSKSNT
ncbi:uncharacterized protein DS421_13g408960 [Arachis hypogaea]|nr:uncharacterized protein DS421_13g408960 [Arachis hypogaea]